MTLRDFNDPEGRISDSKDCSRLCSASYGEASLRPLREGVPGASSGSAACGTS